MSDTADLPAPKWWHIPEHQALLVAGGAIGMFTLFSWNDPDPRFTAGAMVPTMAALGLGVCRSESYSSPTRMKSKYASAYYAIAMSLIVSLSAADNQKLFVTAMIISFTILAAFMFIPITPRKRSYDWSQIYSDPISPHGPSFAAKRLKYWPFVTLVAIFGTLALTRQPAWAILAGAACLAFTPLAYQRNPATHRPVLARGLNLLAVCLIAFAAITLIQKGH